MADFFPNGYFDPDYWGEGYFQADVAGSISATLSGSGGITATLTAVSEFGERGDDAGKPKRRASPIPISEEWFRSQAPYWDLPKKNAPKVAPPKQVEPAIAAVEVFDDDDEDAVILLLAA